jgi:redox-sensitive bicupin YhaK (pirin superfamily)
MRLQHGPFVMNTHDEIVQAFEDLHGGRFGHLED